MALAFSAAILIVPIAVVAFAAVATPIPDKAKRFVCAPTELHDDETLTIRISVPHGTDLALISPQGEISFVYSCDENIRSSQWKNVDCESFANLAKITIKSSFNASSGAAGTRPKRVFSSPGTYAVLLAKNLETENNAQTVNRCLVEYRPHAQ